MKLKGLWGSCVFMSRGEPVSLLHQVTGIIINLGIYKYLTTFPPFP